MSQRSRPVLVLTLAAAGGLLLAGQAWAATPMFGCTASMAFVSDREGEPQPVEHEILMMPTRLPDYVPMLTTKSGYDYCVRYERGQPAGTGLSMIWGGNLSVSVYRLNERGKWRRVVRLPDFSVAENVAFACRNSKKKIAPETELRWVVRVQGLPDLGYLDLYEIDAWLITGGAGDLLEE